MERVLGPSRFVCLMFVMHGVQPRPGAKCSGLRECARAGPCMYGPLAVTRRMPVAVSAVCGAVHVCARVCSYVFLGVSGSGVCLGELAPKHMRPSLGPAIRVDDIWEPRRQQWNTQTRGVKTHLGPRASGPRTVAPCKEDVLHTVGMNTHSTLTMTMPCPQFLYKPASIALAMRRHTPRPRCHMFIMCVFVPRRARGRICCCGSHSAFMVHHAMGQFAACLTTHAN